MKKKLFIKFLLCFVGFLVFLIIQYKYFGSRGIGPLSWIEIWHNLPMYIIFAFGFAVFMYICNYFFTYQEVKDEEEENKKKY